MTKKRPFLRVILTLFDISKICNKIFKYQVGRFDEDALRHPNVENQAEIHKIAVAMLLSKLSYF